MALGTVQLRFGYSSYEGPRAFWLPVTTNRSRCCFPLFHPVSVYVNVLCQGTGCQSPVANLYIENHVVQRIPGNCPKDQNQRFTCPTHRPHTSHFIPNPHRKPFHPACVTGLNRCCTKPKNGHLKRTHTAFCTAPRETSSNGPTKWNIERQTQESGSMVSGIGGRIGMYRQRMTVMIMTLMPTCSRSPLQNRPSNIIKHCSIIVRVLTVPCSPSYTCIFVKKFSSFHLGVSGLSGGKKKNQTVNGSTTGISAIISQ